MIDEKTQLKERLDYLHAKLAAYPTGVRPSWVSTDIAFDRMAVEAVQKRLAELEAAA